MKSRRVRVQLHLKTALLGDCCCLLLRAMELKALVPDECLETSKAENVNPTKIIRESKSGGRLDQKKCLAKLLDGVFNLVLFRKKL